MFRLKEPDLNETGVTIKNYILPVLDKIELGFET